MPRRTSTVSTSVSPRSVPLVGVTVSHDALVLAVQAISPAPVWLTPTAAFWPGSSVSGLYMAHPESRYFSLGKIERDQVADYHVRKGMTVAEVERWLAPNLGYDIETRQGA